MKLKFLRRIHQEMDRRTRLRKLRNTLASGLPSEMEAALTYLISGNVDQEAHKVGKIAESRRSDIAAGGDKKVPIWYSPKPGSAGDDPATDLRPEAGKILEFSMERIAHTGKPQRWATALYLVAKHFECRSGVELGTCAGISALYLAAVPSMEHLVTVEGSPELAKIARNTLQGRDNTILCNCLFDEAIDEQVPKMAEGVDLVYIDGHHEKVATIHYFNRMLPYLNEGAVVLFDDISWSQDMREAWEMLCRRTEFGHAMDLGEVGVCLMRRSTAPKDSAPRYWNLQPIVGEKSIGDPEGWKL